MLRKFRLKLILFMDKLENFLCTVVGILITVLTFYSAPFIEVLALYKLFRGFYIEALICSIIVLIQILINIYTKKK